MEYKKQIKRNYPTASVLRQIYSKVKKPKSSSKQLSISGDTSKEEDTFLRYLDPGSADIGQDLDKQERKRTQKLTMILLQKGRKQVDIEAGTDSRNLSFSRLPES